MYLFLFQVISISNGIKGEGTGESDDRVQRMEDFVSSEVLTYLKLLKMENERRLRMLEQDNPNGQQFYPYEYADSDRSEGVYNYDSDWLQDYDLAPYAIPAAWRRMPSSANRKFVNPPSDRLSMPASGGKFQNGISAYPPFSMADNGMPAPLGGRETAYPGARIQKQMLPLPLASYGVERGMPAPIQTANLSPLYRNRYMQFDKPPRVDDQLGYQTIFAPDGGRGQLSRGRKQVTSFSDLQDEGGYATILKGLAPKPSELVGNLASATPVGGSVKKPSSGQTTIDIESDSDSAVETGVRSLPPKMRIQEGGNAVSTSTIVDGGSPQGNKKYKLLIINGEDAEEVDYNNVHQKLFASQGLDSGAGKAKAMAAASSSSSGGQPQSTFQAVSVSNDDGSFVSSPRGKSRSTKTVQTGLAGDGSTIVTSVVQNPSQELGLKFKNLGGFHKANGVVGSGFQNLGFN